MKRSVLRSLFLFAMGPACFAQGAFLFSDPSAPTEPASMVDPLPSPGTVLSTPPTQEPGRMSSLYCTIGYFIFSNFTVPTHLGSADGPLAGPGIWAQMLLGESPDSLVPVGSSKEHLRAGWVVGDYEFVPGQAAISPWHYVQMLA